MAGAAGSPVRRTLTATWYRRRGGCVRWHPTRTEPRCAAKAHVDTSIVIPQILYLRAQRPRGLHRDHAV